MIKEMFPTIWDKASVQEYIARHQKPE